MAVALESYSLHCLFRGIAEHQSAIKEKLHIKALKDAKNNLVGRRGIRNSEKCHICSWVGGRIREM